MMTKWYQDGVPDDGDKCQCLLDQANRIKPVGGRNGTDRRRAFERALRPLKQVIFGPQGLLKQVFSVFSLIFPCFLQVFT